MKVKVGNRVYDGDQEPVMVILTPKDRENIAAMEPQMTRYAAVPDTMGREAALAWMEAIDEPGMEPCP